MATKPLGELLVDSGVITFPQLQFALKEQSRSGRLLGEILEHLGYATKIQIVRALATQGGVPYIDLRHCLFEPQTLDQFNPALLRGWKVIPLWMTDAGVSVAMADPSDTMTTDRIRETAKRDVFIYGADEKEILHFLELFYGDAPAGEEEPMTFARRRTGQELSPPERMAIRTFHQVLTDGIRMKATDIHIEPDGSVLRVRYRTEGGMSQGPILLHTYQNHLLGTLKSFMQAREDGAKALEGSVRALYLNREFDLKVSILPTIQGDMAYLRPVEKGSSLLGLERLGLSDRHSAMVQEALRAQSGLLLVVGPAASGRTTTLYSLTLEANSIDKNVTTIEDPVEVQLAHINQISLDGRPGVAVPAVLRQLVRQHVDVIMIGQLQDRDSIELAMRATANGALVLGGYTASDEADALTQMLSMGIDPYLVGFSVSLIVAQRLVRTLCRSCRESYVVSKQELGEAEIPVDGDVTLFRSEGCVQCGGTGFSGNTAIFEVFRMTDAVRRALYPTIEVDKLRTLIHDTGYVPLAQDGLEKALRGVTTLEEVHRVLR